MSSKYEAPFATHLRDCMAARPDTGAKTTQAALAAHLEVRPQTVAYYVNGESLPNCEQLQKIADYFGVTCDYLMTGRRVENKPARELLGLSEMTVQNMKLVKDGYFEDAGHMLAVLDALLGEKDFYVSMEKAVGSLKLKEAAPPDLAEYHEWKAAQYMQGFLLDFLRRDIQAIYIEKRKYD
jgi:transcriptional regulator with XRE-family HTH domain